jgi:uncharacterized protein YcbX
LLLASEASLNDLNSRLERPVDWRRFRPNIVVSGCDQAFVEDTWARIQIQASTPLELHIAARCTRCRLPNVDPNLGQVTSQEPFSTLQKYRRVDPGAKYQACFGVNAIPLQRGRWSILPVELDIYSTYHRGLCSRR